jgi:hypothetical protein
MLLKLSTFWTLLFFSFLTFWRLALPQSSGSKPTQLGPVDRASPYPVGRQKNETMDNVKKKVNNCTDF